MHAMVRPFANAVVCLEALGLWVPNSWHAASPLRLLWLLRLHSVSPPLVALWHYGRDTNGARQ